jgi:mannose-6-phosphate isomerase-like protein (cupin superfamily)
MSQLRGGAVYTPAEIAGEEYLPNKGVFLSAMFGKETGHAFGFYLGRVEPGCGIAREVHSETSETIYVLKGQAVGLCGEQEVPLSPGQVLHVQKNVPHGIRNVGSSTLEFLVIGNPDF